MAAGPRARQTCLAGGHEFNSERYGVGGLTHSLLLNLVVFLAASLLLFPGYFENDRIYLLYVDPTEDPVLSMEVVLKNKSELFLQLHDENSMGGSKSRTYSGTYVSCIRVVRF